MSLRTVAIARAGDHAVEIAYTNLKDDKRVEVSAEMRAETGARIAFLSAWKHEPQELIVYTETHCEAYIMHGPGHQSKTRCEILTPHDVHEAHVLGEHTSWRGDETTSGFFNELPEVE